MRWEDTGMNGMKGNERDERDQLEAYCIDRFRIRRLRHFVHFTRLEDVSRLRVDRL